ncbi:MAG: DNA-directed RNA polymerase subunit omega [Candidatus Aminicenantes bacterium]|nr:DNA-directed RNA polymerase subunit omega [Candidatus Aminicenantes bacterium]
MKSYDGIDSKFRYVIISSKRAKELLKGAKPKIKSKSKNPIRIAQEEVKKGLIAYYVIQPKAENTHESNDDILLGEELIGVNEEVKKEVAAEEVVKVKNKKKTPKKEKGSKK